MLDSHVWIAPLFALAAATSSIAQSPWADGVALPGSVGNVDQIQVADLNGDGREDLILAAQSIGRVAVSLALIPGEFEWPHVELDRLDASTLITTQSRHVVAVSDIDLDGRPDLLSALVHCCASPPTTVLHVAYGRGDGTFELGQAPPSVMAAVFDVEIEDIDGDGLPDLVIAGIHRSLIVHRGLGGRAFGQAEPVVEGGTGAHEIHFEDMDGDGFLDLLAQTNDPAGSGALDGANVFYGRGALPFPRTGAVPLGIDARFLDAVDLDLDGDLDVVGWIEGGKRPSVVEAVGARAFAPGVPGQAGLVHNRGHVADVDGDGLADLVYARLSDPIELARNVGQLQFAPRAPMSDEGGGALALFDEDGDGLLDCASTSVRGVVKFLRGDDSTGAYALGIAGRIEEDVIPEAAYALPRLGAAAAGVLLVNARSGRLLEYRTASTDPLVWAQPDLILDRGEDLTASALLDVSGDGRDDLLLFLSSPPRIEWMAGDGAGGLSAPALLLPLSVPGFRPSVVDVDGDGVRDVTWVDGALNDLHVAFVSPVAGLGAPLTVPGPGSDAPSTVIDVDLDGDGDVVHCIDGRLEVSEQLPGRVFAARTVAITGLVDSLLLRMAVAEDVDQDGDEDFVYIDSMFGEMQAVLCDGSGGFSLSTPLVPSGFNFKQRPHFGDFDLDGRRDLSVMQGLAKASNRFVNWSRNEGSAPGGGPSFTPIRGTQVDSLRNASTQLAPIDFDGDGDLDLVFASRPGLHAGLLLPFVARNDRISSVGENYCSPLVPNSTGQAGLLTAIGSTDLRFDHLVLRAAQLPQNSFGFYLASLDAAVVTNVPNSGGTLCLGGAIGRFVGPGEIMLVDASGGFELELDLARIPTPNMGRVPVVAGQTWHFQAWHRELVGGVPTSNFTDAVRVDF